MARRQVGLLRSDVPSVAPAATETFQASIADELASTVEHLISTRYAAERLAEEAPAKRVMQTVTSESLLAELAAARQARGNEPATRVAESKPPRRSGSPVVRIVAFGVIGIVLLIFVCLSPYRDHVPAPLRDQVDRALASLHVH
jgi:hypothetical protein